MKQLFEEEEFIEWFWSMVDKMDTCWNWTGRFGTIPGWIGRMSMRTWRHLTEIPNQETRP